MIKLYIGLVILFLVGSCTEQSFYKKMDKEFSPKTSFRTFSRSVNDSFTIYVHVPENYNNENTTYPVIYILDANLYFDIYAVVMKKYEEIGLLQPAIVIGVGYKDFPTMDSLRNRDYTYPLAIPEYEMETSGKADKFLSFLSNELIPGIDSSYSVDKEKRILMGHSLGGYFTLYALQQNLLKRQNLFSGYIAASPSTHYNHYYILKALQNIYVQDSSAISAYVSFGGLEDGNGGDASVLSTAKVFSSLDTSLKIKGKIKYKADIYTNLDHMDTPLPTFIKGLQWILNKK